MVQVQLCAVVIMPAITVSTDELLFDTVQCGMCQVKCYDDMTLLCSLREAPLAFYD